MDYAITMPPSLLHSCWRSSIIITSIIITSIIGINYAQVVLDSAAKAGSSPDRK
jgi:hypothetical protein